MSLSRQQTSVLIGNGQITRTKGSLFAHKRVACRRRSSTRTFYERVSPDGFTAGMAEEEKKNRRTIYSVRACRARPNNAVVTRITSMYGAPRPRRLPSTGRPRAPSVSVFLTAVTFCENFGVTQKPSQTWACFTRCLGKSGKAAKANSCASDTRHALLYAPSARTCIRVYTRADVSTCARAYYTVYPSCVEDRELEVERKDREEIKSLPSYFRTFDGIFGFLFI